MNYQYGEIFKKLGIPGMGHQGATWCAINSDGVLVLMSHQNYVHRRKSGSWFYEVPRKDPMPPRAPSAARSIRMIEEYFEPDKDIVLPVCVFTIDGGLRSDGTYESSVFKYATGDVYNAKMQMFEPNTGYILCEISGKFSV